MFPNFWKMVSRDLEKIDITISRKLEAIETLKSILCLHMNVFQILTIPNFWKFNFIFLWKNPILNISANIGRRETQFSAFLFGLKKSNRLLKTFGYHDIDLNFTTFRIILTLKSYLPSYGTVLCVFIAYYSFYVNVK